jgi:hypothetical protein
VSEWNVQALDGGGHRVLHHDHQSDERSEVGTFGPEVALDDLVALIADRAADCDYILLPDGSPVVILDLPDAEPR